MTSPMKSIILLLSLFLASCHGKQIVPAGDPEGDDSTFVDLSKMTHIDIEIGDRGKSFVVFVKDSVMVYGDTIEAIKKMRDVILKFDQPVVIISSDKMDTFRFHHGDTVRLTHEVTNVDYVKY